MKKLQKLIPLVFLLGVLPFQAQAWLTADFDPSTGKVPYPTDLLFNGSTDGTLTVPGEDTNPIAAAVSALDGFSTTSPIVVTFSDRVMEGLPSVAGGLDPATVIPGDTVRLFEVDTINPFLGEEGAPLSVTEVVRELTAGVEYIALASPADPSGRTLVILPTQPLKPSTSYMGIITTGMLDATTQASVYPDLAYIFARYRGDTHFINAKGKSNFAGLSDAVAQGITLLQPLVNAQELAAERFGIERSTIALSWTFTTQSIGDSLRAVHATAQSRPTTVINTGMTTADLGAGLPGLANIHVGTLELPYYLDTPSAANPAAPLTSKWRNAAGGNTTRYGPMPQVVSTVTVPLLITTPNGTMPADGWPVAIFQHGVTGDRTDLLGIADSLAARGIAGIAIDLPLHGLAANNPFYIAGLERHFDLDVLEPIGEPDPILSIFLNLGSPLTVRDNSRQAIVDLFNLTATIPDIDVNGNGTGDFDGNSIHYIGHSLGASYGVPFLAIESNIKTAALASPAAQVLSMAPFSGQFAPAINAVLAIQGIFPGSSTYAQFFIALQTVTDSADSINYATDAANRPILMTEVTVAPVEGFPADGVVPNSVPGLPLAGTRPLARLMGLNSSSMSIMDTEGLKVFTSFSEGSHVTLLSGTASLAATIEMQTQVAEFLASGGTSLVVTNPDVLNP